MKDEVAALIEASRLGPKAREAARLRLIEGKPYREVADLTGVNRERIRQIEAKIRRYLLSYD